MTDDLDKLVRLNEEHVESAAETLARAFYDYPVFIYVFPDATERKDKLPALCQSIVMHGLLNGEVYATSPAMEGVAMWLPPSVPGGLPETPEIRREPLEPLERFAYFGRFTNYVRRNHAPARHWKLDTIGVAPEFQGKGHAGALVRPMLDRIDRERLPCYLDTNLEKNLAIYQRYGFKIVDDTMVPGTEIRDWGMLREESV